MPSPLQYGSVCSGIEAASLAWRPLGFEPLWFSEIDPCACAVLAHHYPAVPNLGDMTAIAARVLSGEVSAPDLVIHAVLGDDLDGRPVHVGDFHSPEAAQDAVRRLSFETGFYSRAWEISSAHLSEAGERYLSRLAEGIIPPILPYLVFRFPDGPLGVKLIATPWTEANLMDVFGIRFEDLHREFRERDVPDDLVLVLEQAGRADVRLLIFDGDAPVLDGLPVHPE
jgi:hypothetical protein